MNDSETQRPEKEFDLGDGKSTLFLVVVVPVILSLLLVAMAVVFGRPIDSSQVLADGPAPTSIYPNSEGTAADHSDAIPWQGVEPLGQVTGAPTADEAPRLSKLITSPERAVVLGLFGDYDYQ